MDFLNINFNEYGFEFDSQWLYFSIEWIFVGILVIGFFGYKIYKKYFIKLEKTKSEWQ